jgi:(4S)-4-hydroxy-5-phosphonooxypentane-2,3-dione isomerase
MMFLFARVKIKPGSVDRFLEYLEADQRGSLDEEGCLRFEVSRDEGDPHVFYLYEVYVDDDAYGRHKQAPYFQAMFTEAGDTFAGPPEGHRGTVLLPGDAGYWRKMR